MRLKRPQQNKTSRFDIRLTEENRNKIQTKANLYCEGNVTEYMVYASLHFVPGKEDFEDPEEIKTPAKKPGKRKR